MNRKDYIGGSDMPIILGLSSYKTPYQLWAEKTGLIDQDYEETPLQYWGKKLEPVIIDEFEQRHQVTVARDVEIIHPEYNYLRAHLDGFINDANAVLEIKCADKYMSHLWEDAGTDGIPMQYLVQVAFYCAMKNVDKAYIAVLIGGNDYREYIYNKDAELEDKIMLAAHEFWSLVKKGEAPQAVNIPDLKLMYPQHDPDKTEMADFSTVERLEKLATIKQQMKKLKELEGSHKFEIMKYMGNAECLTDLDDNPLCTWKANKRGSRTFLMKEKNING